MFWAQLIWVRANYDFGKLDVTNALRQWYFQFMMVVSEYDPIASQGASVFEIDPK